MKQKTQVASNFVVVHKNPGNWHTKGGKLWVVDGFKSNWNYQRAELHVRKCEYDALGIPYEVISIDNIGKYIPSLAEKNEVSKLQPTEDRTSGY